MKLSFQSRAPHSTTADRLQQYSDQRARMGYNGLCDAYFISEQGAQLSYAALNRLFRRLIKKAEIPARTGCRLPSLHCIRHYAEFRTMPSRPR